MPRGPREAHHPLVALLPVRLGPGGVRQAAVLGEDLLVRLPPEPLLQLDIHGQGEEWVRLPLAELRPAV